MCSLKEILVFNKMKIKRCCLIKFLVCSSLNQNARVGGVVRDFQLILFSRNSQLPTSLSEDCVNSHIM